MAERHRGRLGDHLDRGRGTEIEPARAVHRRRAADERASETPRIQVRPCLRKQGRAGGGHRRRRARAADGAEGGLAVGAAARERRQERHARSQDLRLRASVERQSVRGEGGRTAGERVLALAGSTDLDRRRLAGAQQPKRLARGFSRDTDDRHLDPLVRAERACRDPSIVQDDRSRTSPGRSGRGGVG